MSSNRISTAVYPLARKIRSSSVVVFSRPTKLACDRVDFHRFLNQQQRFLCALKHATQRQSLVQPTVPKQLLTTNSRAGVSQENTLDDLASELHQSPLEETTFKPWLDPRRSVQSRVQALVDAPKIHPADLTCREIANLLVECCRLGENSRDGDKNLLLGMQLAQNLVDRLLLEKRRLQKVGEQNAPMIVEVPIDTWKKLLYGWVVRASKIRVAQVRMREVIQQAVEEAMLDDMSSPSQFKLSEPTVDIFNTYLHGLANASKLSPRAAIDAEAVLYEMTEHYKARNWHCKPNTRSYTHVLVAHSNSGHFQAGKRAMDILRRMKQLQGSEEEAYKQQYGIPYDYCNPESNKKQIVTADIVAYTATMKAVLQSGHKTREDLKNNRRKHKVQVPEEVLQLLKEITECQDGSVQMDTRVFVMAIKAFGEVADKAHYGRQRTAAAKQAEQILYSMLNFLAQEKQKKNVSVASTNHVDHADIESGEDNERELDILIAYNTCLNAWAKSYTPEAATHCEALLHKMLEDENDLVTPNASSFNTCLYAWLKSNKFHEHAATRAEEILNLQEEMVASGFLGGRARPDFQTYTIAILAYAHSNLPNKVQHGRRLLERLLETVKNGELEVTRNTSAPFSAVLSAAARSPSSSLSFGKKDPSAEVSAGDTARVAGNDDALANNQDDDRNALTSMVGIDNDPYSIALQTYNEVKEDVHGIGTSADHHVFASFLQCIAKHSPHHQHHSAERDSMTSMVFSDAREAGQVSRLVVDGLQAVFGGDKVRAQQWLRDQYNEIDGTQKKLRIPQFWCSNVKSEFRLHN